MEYNKRCKGCGGTILHNIGIRCKDCHYIYVSRRTIVNCIDCNKRVRDWYLLDKNNIKCKKCRMVRAPKILNSINEEVYASQKLGRCEDCSKPIQKYNNKCRDCLKIFWKQLSEYSRQHRKKYERRKKRRIRYCQDCGEELNDKRSRCDYCDNIYKTNTKLESKKKECPRCGDIFIGITKYCSDYCKSPIIDNNYFSEITLDNVEMLGFFFSNSVIISDNYLYIEGTEKQLINVRNKLRINNPKKEIKKNDKIFYMKIFSNKIVNDLTLLGMNKLLDNYEFPIISYPIEFINGMIHSNSFLIKKIKDKRYLIIDVISSKFAYELARFLNTKASLFEYRWLIIKELDF